ncbi:hypothetical protein OCS_02546 [Ophiocordyceps sinensis CO18]|uniref:Uncharacterized protein n=1 Tax=Ophiocordyceps sinensis (strain Co18 / CGMCC 3.14243) TaxID=911162 RepID=T5AH54_OPHSC|nr:hypothetical protein OCS_02546 [Ophiocordyceps sinensis CO18]
MHVLGHSFSQRRKTCKPRDLHIRKISFSGSSLSSGSSLASSFMSSSSTSAPSTAASSSTSLSPPNSASTVRGPRSSRPPAGLDPLALHPTSPPPMPPPRLCDRPLLSSPEQRRFDESTTFFLEDDEESIIEAVSPVAEAKTMEPDDYFGIQFTKRPALPRSRWSESTVATVDSIPSDLDDEDTVHGSEDDDETPGDEVDQDAIDDLIGHYHYQPTKPLDSHQSMPNFSHKRDATPKRPPIKTLDSLEDFIKRGGWKRRGIVFHQEEVDSDSEDVIHLL